MKTGYKMVREFKGLSGKKLQCHVPYCQEMGRGGGRWCHEHSNNLYRMGHVEARVIRRIQYKKLVPDALAYLRETKDTEATKLALEALDRALSPAYIPTSQRYARVTAALVRLRQDTKSPGGRRYHPHLTMDVLLAEALALRVFFERNPGLNYAPGVYEIMLTRAMLRLKPRAVRLSTINPETWKQECKYDQGLSAKALKLLANRLSEALKLFVGSYIQVLSDRAKHEERLKLAVRGYTSQDEARDAEIEEARQRAVALKPKRNADPANSNPMDLCPSHFTAEERAAYRTLHINAAMRLQEAST